ncbi:BrnT family toxin [Candidatus Uhrbacteria bacterium]|nr:BrnT family toxin [Candidatus Uhrbacteria bacterium]
MKLDFLSASIEGFDWDSGNAEKNWLKHQVRKEECEEAFFNKPLIVFDDSVYSKNEKRYGALGKTNKGRRLCIIFTIRKNMIRIISARDQDRKDRAIYASIEQQRYGS